MTDFVFMLAGDQRWQFEEWCDAHGVDRARIPGVKALIVDAFLAARERSSDVARSGSLLLDEQYASPQIARARAAGVFVGTPSEKAGSLPLEWATTTRFDAAPPGRFVKVLIKDRRCYDAARPACRQIILGKAAPRDTIAKWFATAAPLPTAAGFAIGRSIHWNPGTAWLEGAIGSAEAIDAMVSEYLTLIRMYVDARAGSPH